MKQPQWCRQATQLVHTEIDEIGVAEHHRDRVGHDDLAGVRDARHPGSHVHCRAVIVAVAQLHSADVQPHAHRQLQRRLCFKRRQRRMTHRGEGRTDPVAGVLEQHPTMTSNERLQHLIMHVQLTRHLLLIPLPALRRRLDVRDQKRHRSHRQTSHPPPSHSSQPKERSACKA